MFGFHGCYWRFDLSDNVGERIAIDDSVLCRTLGGVGLGAWLLHQEAPIGVDPLAPEAPLIFSFSPLVGTRFTTSAKFAVVAKSPLTGGISDALASSHFAIAGKALGVDAIVLVGACSEPSELVDGSLRRSVCWGLSAEETARILAPFGRVAAIGVAGERLVRFANLSAEGRHAGRGGLGAVMGSKRLKAIAVRGEVATSVADPARVEMLAKRLRGRAAGESTAKYRELGTVGNLLSFDRLGILPTRNFQDSHFAGAELLAVENWHGTRKHRRSSCASCTIGCEHRFGFTPRATKVADSGMGVDASDDPNDNPSDDGRRHKAHAEVSETRVEYESLFALGPLCGIDDPDMVLAASKRCDDLGIDTISVGATLAFAMECRDRGLTPHGPRFGDPEAMLGWLDDIAHRRGLGDQMAEGSRRLAESLGQGSIDFAPQVKGLELPGYEPRALQALALGLAVGTRGADHNRSGAYEMDFDEGVGRLRGNAKSAAMAIETEDRAALLDSLILCKFVRGALEDFYSDCSEMLRAVTGHEFSPESLLAVSKGIVDLRKAFNIREGWRPQDDTLPSRFLTESLTSGPSRGARLPRARLAEMIRNYNLERGWSEDGWIPASRISGLNAEFALRRGDEAGQSPITSLAKGMVP